MNLLNLREDLTRTLKESGLTQYEFAARHGLSYSWINKFLNDVADNPRLSSLNKLEAAIRESKARRQ